MKKFLSLVFFLSILVTLGGTSFTDAQPVDVDVGIEQADLIIQDACDLTVVTILTFEVDEVALPIIYPITFTENVITWQELYALPDLNINSRVIAYEASAATFNHWQNPTGIRYQQTHLWGPSSIPLEYPTVGRL